jgi:hypothetical protein
VSATGLDNSIHANGLFEITPEEPFLLGKGTGRVPNANSSFRFGTPLITKPLSMQLAGMGLEISRIGTSP